MEEAARAARGCGEVAREAVEEAAAETRWLGRQGGAGAARAARGGGSDGGGGDAVAGAKIRQPDGVG